MRAISLWQPWASAIALGSKRIETRDWPSKYRGPLAIHAAKRMVKGEMISFASDWKWCGALHRGIGFAPLWETLPFGAIVAVCNIVDCRPTELIPNSVLDALHGFTPFTWTERDMGNFNPDRFGWVLDNITPLTEPLPFKGAQGFFDVPNRLFEGRFDDIPKQPCPNCHAMIEDFDGFGVLAHEECGYCSHPSRTDGVCGICGDTTGVGHVWARKGGAA